MLTLTLIFHKVSTYQSINEHYLLLFHFHIFDIPAGVLYTGIYPESTKFFFTYLVLSKDVIPTAKQDHCMLQYVNIESGHRRAQTYPSVAAISPTTPVPAPSSTALLPAHTFRPEDGS